MVLKDFINNTTASLTEIYPKKEAHNIVLMLCEDRIGTKSYTHIIEPDYMVPEESQAALLADAKRLIDGEPIQYVIGHAEFCGRRFLVNENVLIPRPETEILCEKAVEEAGKMTRVRAAYGKNAAPVRILDLCSGSGNISWTLALNVPGSEVVGVDINEESVKVASEQDFSVELKKLKANTPEFRQGDILSFTDEDYEKLGTYDLILSNPPYIMEKEKSEMRKNVIDYEPDIALFVPDSDPLRFYEAIAVIARKLLNPEGVGLVEINEFNGELTAQVFKKYGFSEISVIKDFNNRNRYISFHQAK